MSEIIDIKDRNICEWAAIVAITYLDDFAMDRVQKFNPSGYGNPLTVELKINGVDCSFKEIIRRMEEEMKRKSFELARQILEERAEALQETLNSLHKIANDVEDDLKTRIRKLIPEALTEEDYR